MFRLRESSSVFIMGIPYQTCMPKDKLNGLSWFGIDIDHARNPKFIYIFFKNKK